MTAKRIKKIPLSNFHRYPLKEGEVVALHSPHSLTRDSLLLKVERVVEEEDRKQIIGKLMKPSGEEGARVIVKQMHVDPFRYFTEGVEPLLPLLLPGVTIAVDRPEDSFVHHVVQLHVEDKPDPKQLARDLAYIVASAVHTYRSYPPFDINPENVGKKPYDIAFLPPEAV